MNVGWTLDAHSTANGLLWASRRVRIAQAVGGTVGGVRRWGGIVLARTASCESAHREY